MHVILFYITGLADFIPFLNDFVGAILYMGSALALCCLVQKASGSAFSTVDLLVASCVYISLPIVSFKFIYEIDVVVTMGSFLLVPCSIYAAMVFLEGGGRRYLALSLLLLLFGISSYESFNAVYVCEVLMVLALESLFLGKKPKRLLGEGVKFAAMLVAVLVLYYCLVKVVQFATGNPAYVRSSVAGAASFLDGFKSVRDRLFFGEHFFAWEIAAFLVALCVFGGVTSFLHRAPFAFVLVVGVALFSLSIQLVQAYVYYRTCQAASVVAFFATLLVLSVFSERRNAFVAIVVVFGLLVTVQLRDINLWFYKDWTNYQKNVYAINRIATDLEKECDLSKPVCFVNRDYGSFLMTWDDGQQEIGESPLISSIDFLGDVRSPATIYLFEQQGYDYLIMPTKEQAEEAVSLSEGMPPYPHDGYIKEEEGFIIVNFGVQNE